MLRVLIERGEGLIAVVGINYKDMLNLRSGWEMEIDLKEMAFEGRPRKPVDKVIVHFAMTHVEVLDAFALDHGIDITPEYTELAKALDLEAI